MGVLTKPTVLVTWSLVDGQEGNCVPLLSLTVKQLLKLDTKLTQNNLKIQFATNLKPKMSEETFKANI